jgi:hypothetical protein
MLATKVRDVSSRTGAEKDWKHLARHAAVSGQDFCGQSGQCFACLWQGISPVDAAMFGALAIASAEAVDNGT